MSRNISVVIETKPRTGRQKKSNSTHGRGKSFSLLQCAQNAFGNNILFSRFRGLSRDVKWPER